MPRLTTDPNTVECPDYDDPRYLPMRLPLVNNAVSNEQAAILLKTLWNAQNTIEKQQWQVQLDDDHRQLEERQKEFEAEEKRKEEELAKAKEEALRDEMKKNKTKYAPIPKRGIPSSPPIIPAASAARKMDKGEYVPIWYYTKAGLENAKTFASLDDDALTLVMGPDGTTTAVPATNARDTKGMVKDHALTLEQFQVGAMRMLTAMRQANWPLDRVKMMESFWTNILDHPYRTSLDERDQLALLLYQSEQRKQWFLTINSPAYAYDLSEINEDVLKDAKDRVRYILLDREDKKRAADAAEGLVSELIIPSSSLIAKKFLFPLPVFPPSHVIALHSVYASGMHADFCTHCFLRLLRCLYAPKILCVDGCDAFRLTLGLLCCPHLGTSKTRFSVFSFASWSDKGKAHKIP